MSFRARGQGERNPLAVAVTRFIASALVAVVAVSLLGFFLLRRTGRAEAITDAKDLTRAKAETTVQPLVNDAVLRGDPRALRALDAAVRRRVLGDGVVRVKIWDRTGRVVYSDEPRLIGARYGPKDPADFEATKPVAELSDLDEPENRFERSFGELLEVYMPVSTPDGRRLSFEAYYRSSFVSARGRRISRHFIPPMIAALVLLALIQLPLAWQLARRVRETQREREKLLRRAIEASELERRRIAGDLHDGVVQNLAGVSFSLTAAARAAPPELKQNLLDAAAETRQGIRELRTLLVEIYPPELQKAGLEAALSDLLAPCASRGIETDVHFDLEGTLSPETEALFFRAAQEALRNVVKHADADHVRVEVASEDHRGTLVVSDDGRGFAAGEAAGNAHFGLRLLHDLAAEAGGSVDVESQPGRGTTVRVQVPL